MAIVGSSSSRSSAEAPDAAARASRAALSHACTAADSKIPATGALLVGGASRRFGSPKALALVGGETLARRAWRTLGAFSERIAVGKRADGLELPFPLEDDGSDVRAPLAGLVAALRRARYEVCVVVPVDVPLVTADALRTLTEACAGDAAVPRTGPLPGAYRRAALPVLERRLASGQLALRDALAELNVRVVDLDPALLVNVNTPDDLAALSRPAENAPRSPGDETSHFRHR